MSKLSPECVAFLQKRPDMKDQLLDVGYSFYAAVLEPVTKRGDLSPARKNEIIQKVLSMLQFGIVESVEASKNVTGRV